MSMNESEFENELRALRPVAPNPALEQRIGTALRDADALDTQIEAEAALRVAHGSSESSTTLRDAFREWLQRLGWALAGAAAAVAIMTIANRPTPSRSPEIAASAPATDASVAAVAAGGESELVDAEQTGILYTEGAEPFRQMRFRSLERYAWTDPDTGARIEVEVPREDIVTMPVAMQ